tara:strand:+ start:8395 stop:9843 length:1449 start_codon:yes stop_codon:yes gene_type:complete
MENSTLLFNKSFVNGLWVAGSEKMFNVVDPANGEIISRIFDGGIDVTSQAIDAAHSAFKDWRNITPMSRSVLLERLHNLIMENQDLLAEIMTRECGKPLKESVGEVIYASSFLKWFAEEGKRSYGDVIPASSEKNRILVTKEPIGVVAAITPWNFPMAMITRKIGAALAAGCTVVVRPSEETPLTALAIAHLAKTAGFPPGVVNVVVGNDPSAMGKVLCDSNLVMKISFTGSTRVGRILMSQSSQTLKKLSLELGGNAPFIVFEDADIDAAVLGAITSKFRNAGQTCVCTNRILIHEKIYDDFTKKFVNEVSKLKLGNGMELGTHIGPMINLKAIEKVEAFVEDAKNKGGEILVGGHRSGDFFFEPTIIGKASVEMDFAKEEIFGPVAPIFKFSSDEEAIEMANDTEYGLAAYMYTQDMNRCWKISEALEYGMVGINEGIISTEVAPFGGIKQSGMGREGSKYGIEDYLVTKYVCYGVSPFN